MTVPLRNEINPAIPKVVGIYRTFVAVAGTVLAFLVHRNVMLRGGIDLGKAVDIPPLEGTADTREIYGAVIERAYSLESKVAQYPRVVIGDTLLRFLDDMMNGADQVDRNVAFNARMASRCKDLLIVDPFDGRVMLDFLGAEIRGQSGVISEQVVEAREFIASEHERFIAERNDTLAVRYNRLLIYIDHALRSGPSAAEGTANRA